MGKKKGGSSAPQKRQSHPYSVFVSHATDDKWIAEILCEQIEQNAGASTFRDDRDIQGGDSIPEEIKTAIRECSELVVLLTPQSIERQWVLIEIGIAIGVERRIVPLFYHVDPDQTPSIIKDNRGFHLNDLDQYLEDLSGRVHTS